MIKIIYHPLSTLGGIALILKNFILLPQYWEGATCIFAKYFNPPTSTPDSSRHKCVGVTL